METFDDVCAAVVEMWDVDGGGIRWTEAVDLCRSGDPRSACQAVVDVAAGGHSPRWAPVVRRAIELLEGQ